MNFQKLKLIIRLGRLHFLVAGFLLYAVGVLFAVVTTNQFSWERFLWGYAVLLTAHLVVNYSNEYYDQEIDRYSSPTQFSGGSGVLLSNPELADFAKFFSISMVVTSLSLGAIFSYIFNSPVFFVFTIFGNLLGWFYSAPPLSLSYHGFGEIATVLTGFLIPGLGYVAIMGIITVPFIVFTIPLMLFLLLFILSVEIPDLEADLKGRKNTLIVRYGREKGLWSILISSSLATACFILLFPENQYNPINFNIIALLSLIPLLFAILALLKRNSSVEVIASSSTRNVPALILFITLVNIYFLTLI